MAYIDMAYIGMAYIVMAYVDMAYIVMAYIDMAYIVMAECLQRRAARLASVQPPANTQRPMHEQKV